MYLLTLALLCQLPPAMPPLPVSLETRAAQAVQPDTPAVVARPAGVLHSPAAFVAIPSAPFVRSQSCAGGVCQQTAQEPRRFQPLRRSRGVLFPNAFWNR